MLRSTRIGHMKMNKLKFLSILIVTAFLAVVVTFSACKKDKDPDPADEGVKAAKEMCNCFEKAEKDAENLDPEVPSDAVQILVIYGKMMECVEGIEKKYKQYENNKAFNDAAEKQFEKCDAAEGWDE